MCVDSFMTALPPGKAFHSTTTLKRLHGEIGTSRLAHMIVVLGLPSLTFISDTLRNSLVGAGIKGWAHLLHLISKEGDITSDRAPTAEDGETCFNCMQVTKSCYKRTRWCPIKPSPRRLTVSMTITHNKKAVEHVHVKTPPKAGHPAFETS